MFGDRGDELLLNTLNRCRDRALYHQHALQGIFEATSNRNVAKPDLLQVRFYEKYFSLIIILIYLNSLM